MSIIFLLFLLFPCSLENIQKEEIGLNEDNKYIVLMIDNPLCHKCYLTIENSLRKIVNRNFIYIVLFNINTNTTARRAMINQFKEKVIPEEFAFFSQDSCFKDLIKVYDINYYPSIFFVSNNEIQYFSYEFLFGNKSEFNSQQAIDSLFIEFQKK